jgi:GGDEF domain-containing protein
MWEKIKQGIKLPILSEISILSVIGILLSLALYNYKGLGLSLSFSIPLIFLVLITLVVTRYGMGGGMYTASIVTLFYLGMSNYASIEIRTLLSTIASFFIPLLLFSPVYTKNTSRIQELQNELENTIKSQEQLSQECAIIGYLKEDYEKKILLQSAKLSEFYEDALCMQDLSEEPLYDRILDMMMKYLEVEKCSLYLENNGKLELRSFRGYKGEDKPIQEIDAKEDPYNTVFQTKEVLSISHEVFQDKDVSILPVYVGLLKTSGGKITGIVNIDSISLLKFNRTTRKIFAALCNWASKALENAHLYADCENRRIVNNDTGIYTYPYFKIRLEEAFISAKSTGTSFSLLMVHIKNWEKIHDRDKPPVIKFVSRVIQQNIRDFDLLSHFENENEFSILMPQTGMEEFKTVISSMEKHLNTFKLQPYGDGSVLQLHLCGLSCFDRLSSIEEVLSRLRCLEAENRKRKTGFISQEPKVEDDERLAERMEFEDHGLEIGGLKSDVGKRKIWKVAKGSDKLEQVDERV